MVKDISTDLPIITGLSDPGNVPEMWKRTWDYSMSTFPGNGIEFLQPEFLKAADDILMLPDKALEALLHAAATIAKDDILCRLIWHCSQSVFSQNEIPDPSNCYFPLLGKYMGEYSGMFSTLVLLSGFAKLIEYYEKRHIPYQITIDTLADVKLWMLDYYNKYGKWGLEENNWLVNHFTGKLFRLGRLQFVFGEFKGNIKVFRKINSGETIAFSEPGVQFRKDGQVNGTNGIYETEGIWVSEFEEDDGFIRGNSISPFGNAIKEKRRLQAEQWQLVLSKGDNVLDVHIPAGEKMDFDLCGKSFQRAGVFFAEHFPEFAYNAYACRTWLFDTQFQQMLESLSNIVRFQREFYVYPVMGSDFQVFERVFGSKPRDLLQLPADSKLRRVILDHYSNGGYFQDMGGFILKDEVNWGKETYQGNWDVAICFP